MKTCSIIGCSKKIKAKGFCQTHYSQNYRKNNLVKYSYSNLKSNAKRRGKEFTLTLEEFEKFAIETEYIWKKGKTGKSLSIDRKDNTKGYTLENIRAISLSENSKKFTKQLNAYYDEEEGKVIASVMIYEKEIGFTEDCPF